MLWRCVALQHCCRAGQHTHKTGASTHIHTHYCLLSLPFHKCTTLLITPPVTVHQEVEISEPLILMPYTYIGVSLATRETDLPTHTGLSVSVSMNVCICVCMTRGIRGSIAFRKIIFVVLVVVFL